MFLSKVKKNNVYPRKPQFYYIKVGFKGVKTIQACFRDVKKKKKKKKLGLGKGGLNSGVVLFLSVGNSEFYCIFTANRVDNSSKLVSLVSMGNKIRHIRISSLSSLLDLF